MGTDSSKAAQTTIGVCQVCNICTSIDRKTCSLNLSVEITHGNFLFDCSNVKKMTEAQEMELQKVLALEILTSATRTVPAQYVLQ